MANTTLEAIALTTIGGVFISTISLFLFGLTLKYQFAPSAAPRCVARPPNTIYKPHNNTNNNNNNDPQYRGNAYTGWITWCMSLSYDDMLSGIPGTGTRDNGYAGALLRVNLDGIVLLRFHALCLKVSLFVALVALCWLLPLNYTAGCYKFRHTTADDVSNGRTIPEECSSDSNYGQFTNYDRTTIENIPALAGFAVNALPVDVTGADNNKYNNNNANEKYGMTENEVWARFWCIVGVSWTIAVFVCHLLKMEWKEVLALRRVYYLEADHYHERKKEATKNSCDRFGGDGDANNYYYYYSHGRGDEEENHQNTRRRRNHPWIPHPEMCDTVPNVELYSVLVSGIPSLPSEVVEQQQQVNINFVENNNTKNNNGTNSESSSSRENNNEHKNHNNNNKNNMKNVDIDVEANNNNAVNILMQQEAVDWQLAITTAFFDHAVPRQPGFTSSVAAVTILPDADELAAAWRKWYAAAAVLRRLRFVRGILADRRDFFNNARHDDDLNLNLDGNHHREEEARHSHDLGDNVIIISGDDPGRDSNPKIENVNVNLSMEESAMMENSILAKRISEQCINELGGNDVEEVEDFIFQALNFGPEQQAVYSREVAQSAANCCPFGCFENGLRRLPTNELELLEKDLTAEVVNASSKLKEAQKRVADSAVQHTSNVADAHDASDVIPVFVDTVQLNAKIPGKHHHRNISYDALPSKFRTELQLLVNQGIISASSSGVDSEQAMPERELLDRLSPIVGNRSRSNTNGTPTRRGGRFRMNSEGQICIDQDSSGTLSGRTTRKSSLDRGNDFVQNESSASVDLPNNPSIATSAHCIADDRTIPASNHSNGSSTSIRRRMPLTRQPSDSWHRVRRIRKTHTKKKCLPDEEYYKEKFHQNGVWSFSPRKNLRSCIYTLIRPFWGLWKPTHVVDTLRRNSSFAVVTFTSRQAAVAARHCLVDGRGRNNWITLSELPTPPLADSASWDFKTCRGCCRPVTLSLNKKQQMCRMVVANGVVAMMFIFYTLPISYAVLSINESEYDESEIIKYIPETVQSFLPSSDLLSGFVSGSLFTLFFALCPIFFRVISNFGSNAGSVKEAEEWAMAAYWWFMVVTAFSGSSILNMVLAGIEEGKLDNSSITTVLNEISSRLAKEIATTWMNWIIIRTTVILPANYLLQINTLLFYFLDWNCCFRAVRGGGPGGHIPYRIYIDSGVVFLCMIALSVASPLVAPCALVYFLCCAPLWRRQLIFVYRPKFDGGGAYWPFIFDMCISSLLVMQILLTTMLSLKKAVGAAVLAFVPIVPTLMFRKSCLSRYLRAFNDAALMQSSLLDECDGIYGQSKNYEEREEFRKFLVDAHKAAYIPICIAEESTTDILTTEPAKVEAMDFDSSTNLFSSSYFQYENSPQVPSPDKHIIV